MQVAEGSLNATFRAADNGLVPLSVQTWGPFLFIAHQPAEASLETWLGKGGRRLLPRLTAHPLQHVGTRDYVLRCNWKVVADNYLVRRRQVDE